MAQDADKQVEDVKEAAKETAQQITNVTALPTAALPKEQKIPEEKAPEPAAKQQPLPPKKKASKKKKSASAAKAKKLTKPHTKETKPHSKPQAKKPADFAKAFSSIEGLFPQSTPFNPNPMMETVMSQSTAQFDKFAADAAKMSREGMDAFVKCGTLFAKGFEELSRTAIAMSQSTAEKQAELAQAALSSKTINEFAEKQSKMAQVSFDDFMQNATKISEMSVKLLTEASAPMSEQMNKAMQKASKAA